MTWGKFLIKKGKKESSYAGHDGKTAVTTDN